MAAARQTLLGVFSACVRSSRGGGFVSRNKKYRDISDAYGFLAGVPVDESGVNPGRGTPVAEQDAEMLLE